MYKYTVSGDAIIRRDDKKETRVTGSIKRGADMLQDLAKTYKYEVASDGFWGAIKELNSPTLMSTFNATLMSTFNALAKEESTEDTARQDLTFKLRYDENTRGIYYEMHETFTRELTEQEEASFAWFVRKQWQEVIGMHKEMVPLRTYSPASGLGGTIGGGTPMQTCIVYPWHSGQIVKVTHKKDLNKVISNIEF